MVDCRAPGLLPTCRAHSHKDQAQTCRQAQGQPRPPHPILRTAGGAERLEATAANTGCRRHGQGAQELKSDPTRPSGARRDPPHPQVSASVLAVPRPPPAPLSRLQVAASSRKASPKLHPSPGGWRPFHRGQQLPTSCPLPQVSPEPSPTSCLKEATDSVTTLLSSPEPSGPGHSLVRTRRLGRTEPSGLGSDLVTAGSFLGRGHTYK